MTKIFCSSLIFTIICGLILGGCDNRPPTPRPKWNKPKVSVVHVDQNNEQEQKAVIAIEVARMQYQNALQELLNHYLTIGDVTKSTWATKELNNLSKAREFAWAGVDIPAPQNVEPDKNPSERFLVENVLVDRAAYVAAVDKLALLYENGNDQFKTYIIHTVQGRFLPERTYTYLMSVELPKKYVGQRKIVPEANELYHEAEVLMRGEDGVEWGDFRNLRPAMRKFKRLIQIGRAHV